MQNRPRVRGPSSAGPSTYFARPACIRNLSGGVNTFRLSNGRVGHMPNMINLALGFGAAGRPVGQYRLLAAAPQASTTRSSSGPWDETADYASRKFKASWTPCISTASGA